MNRPLQEEKRAYKAVYYLLATVPGFLGSLAGFSLAVNIVAWLQDVEKPNGSVYLSLAGIVIWGMIVIGLAISDQFSKLHVELKQFMPLTMQVLGLGILIGAIGGVIVGLLRWY